MTETLNRPTRPPDLTTPCLPEEAARLCALAAYDILDTPPEASFDRITGLAARVLRVPISTVTFVDERRQWFKSAVGLSGSETSREHSFCAHALGSDGVLVIPDATRDPRFSANPLVTGPPHIRFYAGAPLMAPRFPRTDSDSPLPRERARLGTLCVIDTVPRPLGLRPHEEDTLRDLAAMVVHALLHRLAAEHQREETAGRECAEAGWRRSEERYQRLAGNGLGVVYQFALAPDGSCSIPLAGEGCREVLHVSPAAVRRDANVFFDLVLPEDRPGLDASIAESFATLDPWRWEGRIRTPDDGTLKWIAATSRAQRQPDGTVLWDGILTDVTARHDAESALREVNRDLETRVAERTAALAAEAAERRRAEEAARESRDLAAILVENATDMIFVRDLDDRYLLVNPAFARAFSKRVEDIVGRDSRSLFSEETVQRVLADDRAVAAGEGTRTVEGPTTLADGRTVRFFQTALTPLRDSAGRVTGIVGISRDVSEREQAARLLQDRARQQAAVARLGRRALELGGGCGLDGLLGEATELVARTLDVPLAAFIERDLDSGAMHHRAVFGWSAEIVGKPISNSGKDDSGSAYILREGGSLTVADLWTETRFRPSPEALRMGLRGAMCVIVARRTDGPAVGEAAFLGVLTVHDYRVRQWTAEDAAFLQAIANVLAAGVDRRRAEEALEAARREAERANAAKSEFLSRMSHELRTPLNAILGFGRLLEPEAETASQRESVDHILRAGHHLLGLIDEVLDIARIESGHLVLETVPVRVGEVAAEAVALVRHTARSRAVSISLADTAPDPGDPPPLAWADPMRLRQVLVNLLSNAVKYNVPGGRVGVRVRRAVSGGNAVRVEVSDTGRGIAAEHRDRLFQPFERLGAESDAAVEGTGIGLAIAKRLVEAMGGTIGVQSAVGEGSTFWVELPVGPTTLE